MTNHKSRALVRVTPIPRTPPFYLTDNTRDSGVCVCVPKVFPSVLYPRSPSSPQWNKILKYLFLRVQVLATHWTDVCLFWSITVRGREGGRGAEDGGRGRWKVWREDRIRPYNRRKPRKISIFIDLAFHDWKGFSVQGNVNKPQQILEYSIGKWRNE